MKIAVTGSNGFIGQHLLPKMKDAGYDIIMLNRSNGFDLSDESAIAKIPDADIIVHLAGLSFVPESYDIPATYYHNNINSTLNVLEYCRRSGARMIFLSSYVYGIPEYLPIDEQHPIRSLNPYGESKIISERLCEAYNRDFKTAITIFRPFNIYGPGQNDNFLIPLIVKGIQRGSIVLKDERPKRDYVHVSDVTDAIIAAIRHNSPGFDIYNIASGASTSIGGLIDIARSCKNIPDFEVTFTQERRPNEVLDTVGSIEKIGRELGWVPRIGLKEGMEDFFKHPA